MSESYQREAAIFDAAMELTPLERAAHLDRACGGDAALRRRIEALLQACDSTCVIVDSPADPVIAPDGGHAVVFEKPGDRIGRYKLLEQIGEGGCGVVYVAEQAEPVRRRVALKVIKLGMDTRSVIARFEAERQALAMMDHPNIAKVLDAGATEAGRPYFVMELVRGMKITEYCDGKMLRTRERLDLFIQVCHAIQHAHQKGIIHRDIKPSNILVTVNDGVPVPKVIDFGVAKATGGQQLTDKTIYTAFEQFIGTPAYMSPEQAVLTSLDIDTRSDIYALGVLLYELLTGKTPFDAKELLEIGLDEMRRTIREQEPQRPSTRVSTLPGQELSTTAQRRGIEAPKLASELRGDLDWIVMKALEKDRTRRYETANGLAQDVQRHLNNEPVVACPPGRLYRLKKTVQRNKLAFVAAGAVAVSLIIGLAVSTILFFRERAAREEASGQASLTRTLNAFLLRDLLSQASSDSQAEEGFTPDPDLTVREAVERAALRIGERFKGQPLQEAMIRLEIGIVLKRLGYEARGIPHLEKAEELFRTTLGRDDPRTLNALGTLANAYRAAGRLEQAVPLLEEVMERMKATLGPGARDTWMVASNLALAYRSDGRLDEAIALAEETVNWRKSNLGLNHRDTLGAMSNLGGIYRKAGKLDKAVPLVQETLERMKATLPPNDIWTTNAMANLANCYRDAGRHEEALQLEEEVVRLRKEFLGPEDFRTLSSMGGLANAYQAAGRLDKAIETFEEVVKIAMAKPALRNADTLRAMHDLAVLYRDVGSLDKALPLFEETWNVRKAKSGPDDPKTLDEMNDLAGEFVAARNYRGAEKLYREVLDRFRADSGKGPAAEVPLLGLVLHHLADVLRKSEKPNEARPFAEEAVAVYGRHADWPTHESQHAFEVLKAVLKDLGDEAGTEAVCVKQMAALRAAAAKDDLVALNNLSWILSTSSDPAVRDGRSAVGFAERAVALTERKDPGMLDTLAAACAEAGEFTKAADVLREAIGLCQDDYRKNKFTARLKLYESGALYREN